MILLLIIRIIAYAKYKYTPLLLKSPKCALYFGNPVYI